jgi:superfamily II DNA/RNA helicase
LNRKLVGADVGALTSFPSVFFCLIPVTERCAAFLILETPMRNRRNGFAGKNEMTMKFATLGLIKPLLDAIAKTGYETPTPVQARAVPEALAGRDLLVSAQTGTGKTAGFMLPALNMLNEPAKVAGKGVRVLVLTPTRELAMQVTKAAETYGVNLKKIKTVSIVGGMPYPVQNRLLKAGADILVATPGRLLDQMQSGRVDLSRLEMLILDEADRMLDMGFKDDLEAIVAKTPAARQTLLFSATIDNNIARLAAGMLKDPVRIDISSQQTKHENIEQRLHFADDMAHKNRLLDHVLRDTEVNQAIVFTSTKRAADDLAGELHGQGFAAAALHGDMKQGARTRTLQMLRKGGLQILVATDVAARGIDVQGISHVINYDLPRAAEDYVHRIGRTGRAGKNGIAISFANVREQFQVRLIERFTSQPIPVSVIEGLEPKQRVFDKKPGGAPRKFGDRPGPRSGAGFGGKPAGKTFAKPQAKWGGKFEGNRGATGAHEGFAGKAKPAPAGGDSWSKPASAFVAKKSAPWGDKKPSAPRTQRRNAD